MRYRESNLSIWSTIRERTRCRLRFALKTLVQSRNTHRSACDAPALLSANPRPHNRLLANGHRRAPFALILPSNGRGAAVLHTHTQSCAGLRCRTTACDTLHRGRSLPARRANRRRSRALDSNGSETSERDDGGSTDGECEPALLSGLLVECLDLSGKNPLD